MNAEYLESTSDLRRVQKQLRRRVVKLKFEDSVVQVTCCGGMFKARFAGSNDVAFGVDRHQAVQRLHKLPNMVRSVCSPKPCDIAADRAEVALERAAAKAAKRLFRFEPKGRA